MDFVQELFDDTQRMVRRMLLLKMEFDRIYGDSDGTFEMNLRSVMRRQQRMLEDAWSGKGEIYDD